MKLLEKYHKIFGKDATTFLFGVIFTLTVLTIFRMVF